MKAAGGVIILLAFLLAALSVLKCDKARLQVLLSLRESLYVLGRELSEGQRELWTVFWELAQKGGSEEVQHFFSALCAKRKEVGEKPFSTLWSECVCAALPTLGKEEAEELLSLAPVLGRSDLDAQCAAIERVCAAFEKHAAELRAHFAEKNRVTWGVSFSLGAFVVILLM